jgi:hypothetical protein
MATERKQQDYGFGGGLAGMNPAEMPEEALQKYRSVIQEQVDALQKRYDEPNWFKVAAGFAKPQLGGFLASLGSASEALGENVEQQREQQLPLAQMKIQIEQANAVLDQKKKQNEIYQAWRKSGKPMDADTYSRIMSLGSNTDVATAAGKFYEGAEKGLGITTAATKAMGADPMLQLDAYTKFQLSPDADPKQAQAKQDAFITAVNAAKPPQVDQAQWDAMSRYDKMEAAATYAREQREKGMGAEELMRQRADAAPDRLKLLGSIRDLALGTGITETTNKEGKKISGQEQMGMLLNKFGGNNPMEVFARAAADGKLGETLRDIDVYARQMEMSPEARDRFQTLVKLLAENQVALRGSALNPTDAFSQLQAVASPGTTNSQSALVTLVDLMGHSEKAMQERYKFAKEKKIPYGQLENNEDYLEMRKQQAKKYREIASSNPLVSSPATFDPTKVQSEPKATSGSGTPQNRPNERTIGGTTYVRQPDGSWKQK